jgi:hypothetical protein
MFGQVFTCSACDFEFCSGWSHHAGGQLLVCRNCAAHYLAAEGASIWGPTEGERLQLFRFHYVKRRKRHERRPTGVYLEVATPGSSDAPQGCFRCVGKSLRGVVCESCGDKGSIVEALHAGDPCPECKTGKINEPSECIY